MQVIEETVSGVVSVVVALVARVYAIISHLEMHDDEFMARWFLCTFGEKLFPGIRTAPLQLVDSGIRTLRGKTGAEWFAAGYPCLGTGGGPLDEHDLPPNERKDASAATLAAKMLSIDQYPPIKAMLAHAVRVDRTATASMFDISSVIKAMHRSGVPIAKMCTLYDRIACAWFTVLSGKVRNAAWKDRPTFEQLTVEWLIRNLAPKNFDRSKKYVGAFEAADDLKLVGTRTLQPLLNHFIMEEKRELMGSPEKDRLFEMGGIVDALNMDNADMSLVRDVVFTALDSKWDEQVRFLEALDLLTSLKKSGRLYISGTPLRIMRVTSDNPEINRAARKLDPHHDVFIQRNSDGHVVIWYNKVKFNMDGVAERLRAGDMKARRMTLLPRDRMQAEGTLPEAPWWYYNAPNGQIMNGSRTNRGAYITKLDDNAIVQCVIRGLVAIGQGQ